MLESCSSLGEAQSRALLVLNSRQCERTRVLHLNTLQADRWCVRCSLWSMRSISLAGCFELPNVRNNKGRHCLSGNAGRSQPCKFSSHVRPCHPSAWSLLCYLKLWGLFRSHSTFLVSVIPMPKAQAPVCQHQAVVLCNIRQRRAGTRCRHSLLSDVV